MNLDRYPALSNTGHTMYEFLSQGPKGTIRKVVLFRRLKEGPYNLAFGDWDEVHQKIVDNVRTNNKDRDKVLATVAATVLDFIEHHPGSQVFARGQTTAKTRLYQMGISEHLRDISHRFHIQGFVKNEGWEPFKSGQNYEAFYLIPR